MTSKATSRATAVLLALILCANTLPISMAMADASAPTLLAPQIHNRSEDSSVVLVHLVDSEVDATDIKAVAQVGAAPDQISVGRDGMLAIEVPAGTDARQLASSLEQVPQVEIAVPDAVLSVFTDSYPNDDYYSTRGRWVTSNYRGNRVEVYQRRYLGPQDIFPHSLQIEPLWSVTDASSEPVRVAILDTGFTAPAGDVNDTTFVPMGDYTERDAVTGEPTADVTDGHGHGTMVATTIAATANNGAGMSGAVGDSSVQVLVYKVLRDDGTSRPQGAFDVNEAIMDAADAGARVINCSFGNAGATRDDLGEAFRPAIEYARARGAVVVAAAGNGSLDYVVPPAAVPSVLSVGSIDYVDGTLSPFSNHGRGLDVVATGENVPVLSPGSASVRIANGTSFAAPLVTAAVAVLAAKIPDATAEQLEAALLATADPYPAAESADVTRYGNGKVDAFTAYQALVGDLGVPLATVRYAGSSRFETAATISRTQFPEGSPAAVLASGESWPDALSAGVLARAVGGPLLLTGSTSLPAESRRELVRLAPSEVILVGGASSVSRQVLESIRDAIPSARIVRLAGSDRYATARAVADRVAAVSHRPPTSAIIASGLDFPDALAAVPMAARAGWPIILTDPAHLQDATLRALRNSSVTRVVLVGGESAVGSGIVTRLRDAGFRVVRVAGTDRYATGRAIADWAVSEGILDSSQLGIATGRNFPDALAGGPYMAELGSPIVLADDVTVDLTRWLARRSGEVTYLHVFGSRGVVGGPVASGIATSLGAY